MTKDLWDYILTKGRKVKIRLGQENKCILLSILSKCKLFLVLLSDRGENQHISSINSHMPCTWGHIDLLQQKIPYLAQQLCSSYRLVTIQCLKTITSIYFALILEISSAQLGNSQSGSLMWLQLVSAWGQGHHKAFFTHISGPWAGMTQIATGWNIQGCSDKSQSLSLFSLLSLYLFPSPPSLSPISRSSVLTWWTQGSQTGYMATEGSQSECPKRNQRGLY